MELLIVSFVAGLLTILAPCSISLLPVIIGGSVENNSKWRPLVITASLGLSVIVFTLLLKASTLLIDIPQELWRYFSGGLIIFVGLTILFPDFWNKIAFKLKLYKSEELLNSEKSQKSGILLGASLGPVFTTCSPTYLYIVATVLPQGFLTGFVNLLAYTLGLMLLLLIVGYGGQAVVKKLRPATNPKGWFKRILGTILIVFGIIFFFGIDKVIETKILDTGYLGPINLENSLLQDVR